MSEIHHVEQIVSGGQTGVDRAALDVAIALGIPHGGWCPRGRLAEDGRIPDQYALRETTSKEYRVRTEQNVIDSDATLILYHGKLQGGTLLTFRMCKEHGKPFLLVDLDTAAASTAEEWLHSLKPQVLNVAGPRERTSSGIYQRASKYLVALFDNASMPEGTAE